MRKDKLDRTRPRQVQDCNLLVTYRIQISQAQHEQDRLIVVDFFLFTDFKSAAIRQGNIQQKQMIGFAIRHLAKIRCSGKIGA